jgi:hypothetical protein
MYSTCVYANLLNGPTIYRKLGNANIVRTYIDTRYRMFHPITKTDHNQNGPLPKRTIEIKNVNFLNKYDILCIISMILYVFNYLY